MRPIRRYFSATRGLQDLDSRVADLRGCTRIFPLIPSRGFARIHADLRLDVARRRRRSPVGPRAARQSRQADPELQAPAQFNRCLQFRICLSAPAAAYGRRPTGLIRVNPRQSATRLSRRRNDHVLHSSSLADQPSAAREVAIIRPHQRDLSRVGARRLFHETTSSDSAWRLRPGSGRSIAASRSRAGGGRGARGFNSRRGSARRAALPIDRASLDVRPDLRSRRLRGEPGDLLRRDGARRGLENHQQRDDVRSAAPGPGCDVDRRRHDLSEQSRSRLGRDRRVEQSPEHVMGRRRLQVDQRRQDLRQHGAAHRQAYQPNRHRSSQQRHRLRGRDRQPVGTRWRARRVQDRRRRQDLEARGEGGRGHGRQRSGDGSFEQ